MIEIHTTCLPSFWCVVYSILLSLSGPAFVSPFASAFAPEIPSQKQGEYRNPILWADYSDPDVIRVGTNYYLVASTFSFMPGVPVLRSNDLVHWTIIGHVFPRLDVDPRYSMIGGNRYGQGAWAPSIRFHSGRYYVYFPTPEEGIFVSTATDPSGPWTPPMVVLPGRGYEDPCPFWDDDGQAYLIHSRLGAGPLILHRLSPDGLRVLDAGTVIVDDPKNLPVLEGPKLYKRNGYFYIFAPFGGVGGGAQTVLRSRNILGPYEFRTVLAQGSTNVRGPHQGGYVETPTGEGWFLHFHSEGAYGRIDDLEPVRWENDWPIVGQQRPGVEVGEPVTSYKLPTVDETSKKTNGNSPATSDEFNVSILSPQWEWNHNPWTAYWSLLERPGYLRLHAMPASDLLDARNTLTELSQDSAYAFWVKLDTTGMANGQSTGIAMFSDHPSFICVVQHDGILRLKVVTDSGSIDGPEVPRNLVQLRVQVANERAVYSWSGDGGRSFRSLGNNTAIHFAWWKAPRPAIFTFNTDPHAKRMGYVDFDWAHYEVIARRAGPV